MIIKLNKKLQSLRLLFVKDINFYKIHKTGTNDVPINPKMKIKLE